MRSFEDRSGAQWDVVLGRESWGALLALFVPRGSLDPVRQVLLRSDDVLDAQRQLDDADDATLQQLLDGSEPKES